MPTMAHVEARGKSSLLKFILGVKLGVLAWHVYQLKIEQSSHSKSTSRKEKEWEEKRNRKKRKERGAENNGVRGGQAGERKKTVFL